MIGFKVTKGHEMSMVLTDVFSLKLSEIKYCILIKAENVYHTLSTISV